MPSTVRELKRQAEEDLAKKVLFTNIDDEDFTWTYDGNPIIVKAHKTQEFPQHIGILLRKHLYDKIKGKEKFINKDQNELFGLIVKWL